MVVFFNFAAKVFLVGYKTAFDRLRPDDSIHPLICVPGRFNNKIVRDAFKDFADQLWSGCVIGDGAVGVDAPAVGDVPVGEALEAVVLHNAYPSVRASKLLDHVSRDYQVAWLSLTVRCSLPCLLREQYDAGLRIRIQGIRMSMHRGRKRNCIQGPRR